MDDKDKVLELLQEVTGSRFRFGCGDEVAEAWHWHGAEDMQMVISELQPDAAGELQPTGAALAVPPLKPSQSLGSDTS